MGLLRMARMTADSVREVAVPVKRPMVPVRMGGVARRLQALTRGRGRGRGRCRGQFRRWRPTEPCHLTARPSVIGITADDDRYLDCRHQAMVIAAREDLELILYDWDAPQLFGDPLPSFWSAEGTEEAVPDRLDERWLERAGREGVASQVRESAAAGVATSAWLPSRKGMEAMAAVARDHDGPGVVAIPANWTRTAWATRSTASGWSSPRALIPKSRGLGSRRVPR